MPARRPTRPARRCSVRLLLGGPCGSAGAFRELAIDELSYLAQQKAEREVGAGMEAYAVQVDSAGIPLTGDESRESRPATYKVRERR